MLLVANEIQSLRDIIPNTCALRISLDGDKDRYTTKTYYLVDLRR